MICFNKTNLCYIINVNDQGCDEVLLCHYYFSCFTLNHEKIAEKEIAHVLNKPARKNLLNEPKYKSLYPW